MVVRQLTEHVQGDVELIKGLKDAGVVPNARVTVETSPAGGVTIVIPGHEVVELPHHMAHAVKVEKVKPALRPNVRRGGRLTPNRSASS